MIITYVSIAFNTLLTAPAGFEEYLKRSYSHKWLDVWSLCGRAAPESIGATKGSSNHA